MKQSGTVFSEPVQGPDKRQGFGFKQNAFEHGAAVEVNAHSEPIVALEQIERSDTVREL